VSARIAVRVAGNVRIVDVKTGEQMLTLPLDGSFEDRVHFADAFTVNGNGVGALTMREHTDGIGVDNDVWRLGTKERRELQSEDDLTRAVIQKLSGESAQAVLGAIDVERTAVDPTSLTLTAARMP
jgi:hypothetical protein